MTEDQERAFHFVVSLRDFYGDYHAKKEREAYAVAVLYLAATAAFLAQNSPDREKLLLGGVIAATLVTVVLVIFQLYNRWFAARMIAACTTVASRWLTAAPIPEHYQPARLGPSEWPDAVVRAFHGLGTLPPLLALVVVPALLFLWGVAVVIWKVCP
jgi:uncharacterized BrkB/YihY/UPF0761 family membrane protein